MIKEPLVFKKGTIINFTGGEYSDKWTSCPYVVLKDINEKEVVEGTCNTFESFYSSDVELTGGPECHDLITYLRENDYIETYEPSKTWFLGDWELESPFLTEKYRKEPDAE